jgi:hypothetical protein
MGKFFGFLLVVLIGSFAYFSLRPTDNIGIDDVDKIVGKVDKIYQKSNDIYIKMKSRDETYFIKDAIKHGIFLQRIKKGLEGKIITIYYLKNDFDHFDPLDPFDTNRYVAKVKSINEVVYNEMK